MAAALEHARRVKELLASQLRDHPAVNAVGVARIDDGWGVKVNLARRAPCVELPSQIDGVPVWTDVVGPIVAR